MWLFVRWKTTEELDQNIMRFCRFLYDNKRYRFVNIISNKSRSGRRVQAMAEQWHG